MEKQQVIVETKYADGTVKVRGDKVEIHPPKRAKAPMAEIATVKKVQPKNGIVAVDFPEEEAVMGYCLKCKEKVAISKPKDTVVSGRNAISGVCPKCGTRVYRFSGGSDGAKPVAEKKAKPKTDNGSNLSPKARAAAAKLAKMGQLADCWVGTLKSGASVWWEGSTEEGWRIGMDDVQESEMAEFKKLVVKSL